MSPVQSVTDVPVHSVSAASGGARGGEPALWIRKDTSLPPGVVSVAHDSSVAAIPGLEVTTYVRGRPADPGLRNRQTEDRATAATAGVIDNSAPIKGCSIEGPIGVLDQRVWASAIPLADRFGARPNCRCLSSGLTHRGLHAGTRAKYGCSPARLNSRVLMEQVKRVRGIIDEVNFSMQSP